MLVSGCLVTAPTVPTAPQDPAAQRAAFDQIDWGYLKPYIGRHYANSRGDVMHILPNPEKGSIEIVVLDLDGLKDPRAQVIQVRPRPAKDSFHMLLADTGLFNDDDAIVRFDSNGTLQVIGGGLHGSRVERLKMTLKEDGASFYWLSSGGTMKAMPRPLQPDMYFLPNGKAIPISLTPDSPFQKLRTARYGIWEHSVGKSFVSETNMLKLEKDDAGNLVLVYLDPTGSLRPGRDVFGVDEKTNKLRALSLPNLEPGTFKSLSLNMFADDRIDHRYELTRNLIKNGNYREVYINRGNVIHILSLSTPPDGQPAYSYESYYPWTPQRLAAAAETRKRRAIEREENRIAAERRAEERRRERQRQDQAMTAAIMGGLSSGFAQASQTNARLEQIMRQSEYEIQRAAQQRAQEAARAAPATRQAATAQAANSGAKAPAAGKSDQAARLVASASTGSAANQAAQEALRKKEEQRKADAQKAAEQARLAADMRREEEKARREEAARQSKERQQKALADHLAAERRGIRLRAQTCPGDDGLPSVMGSRPKGIQQVANCIAVHFEARCPSERPGTGLTGSIERFLGSNTCFDNSPALPRKLNCDVKQAIVDVKDVTTCP